MPTVQCLLAEAPGWPPGACVGVGRVRQPWLLSGLCLALAACSPVLDWRQVRPQGWGLGLLMPCRPDPHERSLRLAGEAVRLGMLVCEADGQTFALASAELTDPGRVGPALQALIDASRVNLQAQASAPVAAQIKGMTPHPLAGQWSLQGTLPDGRPVSVQVLVFSRGSRVYQATIMGARADQALGQTFFDAIELTP